MVKSLMSKFFTGVFGLGILLSGVFLIIHDTVVGCLLIALGIASIIVCIVSFVSKSPKIKLINAIDEFLLALVLFGFAAFGWGNINVSYPWYNYVLAVLMVFLGLWNLYDYFIADRKIETKGKESAAK